MSQAHAWTCGKCGARLLAQVGTIVRTFQAHIPVCPGLPRRPAPPVVAKTARAVPPSPHPSPPRSSTTSLERR